MKTCTMQAPCGCTDELEELDSSGYSSTLCCHRCCRAVLSINHPEFCVAIPLEDFYWKRGEGWDQRPLNDLSMAKAVLECLSLDEWPSPSAVVDFGISSSEHLGALQHAIASGVTAYDLDRVLGDGPAITRLVRSIPDQPYAEISFATAYDNLELDFQRLSCDDGLIDSDDD